MDDINFFVLKLESPKLKSRSSRKLVTPGRSVAQAKDQSFHAARLIFIIDIVRLRALCYNPLCDNYNILPTEREIFINDIIHAGYQDWSFFSFGVDVSLRYMFRAI